MRLSADSSADGVGDAAAFSKFTDVTISADDSFALVAGYLSNKIHRIDLATGAMTTQAGNSLGNHRFADGTGAAASFYIPSAVAIAPDRSFGKWNKLSNVLDFCSSCSGGYGHV